MGDYSCARCGKLVKANYLVEDYDKYGRKIWVCTDCKEKRKKELEAEAKANQE